MLENTNLALVASTSKRKITLHDLFDKYLKTLSASSRSTIRYYTRDFENFTKVEYAADITIDDIQEYIDYKKDMNLEDSTIFRYYENLTTIFNYAISHEYITKNPCKRC